ncbi:helix-turn-helix domain-containing protein [Corynebacterium sp. AOP40-9SA-29]|uniref:helix-turn-helix domain-containing protein n=1 Tax=Corynebacterium sp. AOP40-9SA-29 TaxID=3457677 RepID=UPI00403357BB
MTTVNVHRPDDLGPELREVRLEKKITQSTLAEKASVGRQWLNAFELGDKWTAPLDMVYRVLSALEVTVVMDPEPRAAPRSGHDFIDINLIVDGPAKP